MDNTALSVRSSSLGPTPVPVGGIEPELQAVSVTCKQLIVALKLFLESRITVEEIMGLRDEVGAHLNTLRNSLDGSLPLTSISQALQTSLDDLVAGKSGVEQVKKVVIALLQELAVIKRSSQLPSTSAAPSPTPSANVILRKASIPDEVLSGALLSKKESSSASSVFDHYADKSSAVSTENLQAIAQEDTMIFIEYKDSVKKVQLKSKTREVLLDSCYATFQIARKNSLLLHVLDLNYNVFYDLDDFNDLTNGSHIRVKILIDSPVVSLEDIQKQLTEIKESIRSPAVVQMPVADRKESLTVPIRSNRPSEARQMSLSGLPGKLKEAAILRRDLTSLKKFVKLQSEAYTVSLNSFRSRYTELAEQKRGTKSETEILLANVNELRQAYYGTASLVSQLRNDILRGVTPPETYLNTLKSKLQDLKTDSTDIRDTLSQSKPKWKRQWEEHLQGIVRSQQSLKESETNLNSVEDSIGELSLILEQCLQIIQVKKENGIQRRFSVPDKEDHHDGLTTVMHELATVEADSERRVKALERNQKLRMQELEMRQENAFRKELTKFTFKRKDGVEAIELLRNMKDQENIQKLFDDGTK